MAYPVVDLRPRLAGSPQPNQGTVARKSSCTIHYNGPPVRQADLAQLLFDARYHLGVDWGGGARANGIQYEWAVGSDGTQYRLRNPRSILWHCAHPHGNAYSYSVTFLIGEGQRITKAALDSAAELCDRLRKEDSIALKDVYGHREWSATACPGTAQADFVVPYRTGGLRPAPAVALPAYKRMTIVHANTDWTKPRAEFLASLSSGISVETNPERVRAYSQVVYDSQPVGARMLLALGKQSAGMLSPDASGILDEYPASVSDIRRGFSDAEVYREIATLTARKIVPSGSAGRYRRKFGPKSPASEADPKKPTPPAPKPPKPPTPLPKSVDVGPYAKDSVRRINGFFGTNYGQEIAEEANRAGLDLAIACALVEQESNGRNIFGADYGTRGADRIPFAHLPVTKGRVQKLVAHIRSGGVSNGVGLSQITWRDFIYEAESLGGAHIPRNQLRVGFRLLRAYLGKYDYYGAIGSYNAGEGSRNSVRWTYSASVAVKHAVWKARLG